jgi:hypothetical protein|tara:strand:- start:1975 stop:2319 length:345 start_codon:yes stop_codon:yes gene_type:complete
MENTPSPNLKLIEEILQSASWKIKNDDELCLMAQKVVDKSPQTPKDLHACVEKFIVDGHKFNKGLKKTCAAIQKKLAEAGCVGEKKEKPKEDSDLEDTPSTQFEDSESQSTPMR